MDEWCTNQHGKVCGICFELNMLVMLRQSGLTAACLSSPHSTEFVAKEVLAYIKKWVPDQRVGVLAGNTVHFDKIFLAEQMPEVVDWLHYRYDSAC